MTLTEFLLARIAEDEKAAKRGRRHNDVGVFANDNYGCLLVDPARVLDECAAKQRIVEMHSAWHVCVTRTGGATDYVADEDGSGGAPCPTLLALASVYADHPDYQQDWS